MNEPVADEHEQWNQLVAKVHKALRSREPQRTLVIGSNRWQGHETMKYLKVPEGDKNIVLSFHYYNPMLLTHYGAWWTPLGKYKGKIHYPGVLVSKEDYEAASNILRAYGISTRSVSSLRMPLRLRRNTTCSCSVVSGVSMSLWIVNWPITGRVIC